MQITPRVHVIPAQVSFYTGPYPPNVYLVMDGGQGALLDAGFADEGSLAARLDYLRGISSLDLRYIVITHHHFDHASGAHRLRQATGARIVMHQDEAPLLQQAAGADTPQDMDIPEEAREAREVAHRWREEAAQATPDVTVADGDAIQVGGATLRAVHTPGHTAGHLCLLLEEEGVLFSGDNVLGVGTTAVPPPPHGDMALYLDSLRRMQGLESKLLLPGHGPPVKEPRRKIQELIDHRAERDSQILEAVGQGRDTLKSLVRFVYPELDRRLLPMAMGQILSHLHKLENEGKLHTRREGEEVHVALPHRSAPGTGSQESGTRNEERGTRN